MKPQAFISKDQDLACIVMDKNMFKAFRDWVGGTSSDSRAEALRTHADKSVNVEKVTQESGLGSDMPMFKAVDNPKTI